MALGGWLSGEIFDLTGSYQAAFLHGIAWNLLNMGIAFWLLMGRRTPKLSGCLKFDHLTPSPATCLLHCNMAKKTIYPLGKCPASLGVKAAGLDAMASLGLPVPQGFVIANPTAADLAAALKKLKPLFFAVRPSVNGQARGYMEAVLNVGLNDETVEASGQTPE